MFLFECTRHILSHTMNGIYAHFTILQWTYPYLVITKRRDKVASLAPVAAALAIDHKGVLFVQVNHLSCTCLNSPGLLHSTNSIYVRPLTKMQWAHLKQYSSITLYSYVLSVQASHLPFGAACSCKTVVLKMLMLMTVTVIRVEKYDDPFQLQGMHLLRIFRKVDFQVYQHWSTLDPSISWSHASQII